jgi:hypothetical protein
MGRYVYKKGFALIEKIGVSILFFISMAGFIYFLIGLSSGFSCSLKHCKKPMLVRTIPFFFFVNSLFEKEGVVYRNLALKNLLLAMLCWVLPWLYYYFVLAK